MFWREDNKLVYVMYGDGTWQSFEDTWEEGDPEYSCPDGRTQAVTPPTPKRGFGKVWCAQPAVRNRLGNATSDEIGNNRWVQDFENGVMFLIPERGGRPVTLVETTGRWFEP